MQAIVKLREPPANAVASGRSSRKGQAAAAGKRPAAASRDETVTLADDYYEKIEPRLYRRIGKELCRARRVLDLGCGGCRLGRFLAETYGHTVIGVDISEGAFPNHQELGNRTRGLLKCVKADARRLDFLRDQTMDAAVTVWALHEMDRPRQVLEEVRRVLRRGGKLLVVDFPRDSLAQRLWNENYYSAQQVAGILERARYQGVSAVVVEQGQVIWAKGLRVGAERAGS